MKTESMKINDGVMEGGNSPAMPAMFASFFSSKPHSSKPHSKRPPYYCARLSARLYASDAVGRRCGLLSLWGRKEGSRETRGAAQAADRTHHSYLRHQNRVVGGGLDGKGRCATIVAQKEAVQWVLKGDCLSSETRPLFAKGSVESTHKVPSHYHTLCSGINSQFTPRLPCLGSRGAQRWLLYQWT